MLASSPPSCASVVIRIIWDGTLFFFSGLCLQQMAEGDEVWIVVGDGLEGRVEVEGSLETGRRVGDFVELGFVAG